MCSYIRFSHLRGIFNFWPKLTIQAKNGFKKQLKSGRIDNFEKPIDFSKWSILD